MKWLGLSACVSHAAAAAAAAHGDAMLMTLLNDRQAMNHFTCRYVTLIVIVLQQRCDGLFGCIL